MYFFRGQQNKFTRARHGGSQVDVANVLQFPGEFYSGYKDAEGRVFNVGGNVSFIEH